MVHSWVVMDVTVKGLVVMDGIVRGWLSWLVLEGLVVIDGIVRGFVVISGNVRGWLSWMRLSGSVCHGWELSGCWLSWIGLSGGWLRMG